MANDRGIVKESFFDFLKDVRAHVFWLLLALIGYLGATAYKAATGKKLPSSEDEWFDLLLFAPKLLLEYAGAHPVAAALFGVMIAGYFVLGALLYRAHRRLNSNKDILTNGAKYQALIEEIGLDSWWPHAASDGSGAPWDRLKEAIAKQTNTFVYILGANGVDTFGETKSPLYETLQKFNGNIRVILCDAKSTETRVRSEAVGTSIVDYKKAIHRSVQMLKDLRKASKPVDGRHYNGQPNWKIIMTSHILWLQYYAPGGANVAETPVYIFRPTDTDSSIYKLFNMEFERIWRRCSEKPMRLAPDASANNQRNPDSSPSPSRAGRRGGAGRR